MRQRHLGGLRQTLLPGAVLIEWQDPFSGRPHGFPARLHHQDNSPAMKGMYLHLKQKHDSIEGLEVDVIARPFIHIYGMAAYPGSDHHPPSSLNLDRCSRGSSFVPVNPDCDLRYEVLDSHLVIDELGGIRGQDDDDGQAKGSGSNADELGISRTDKDLDKNEGNQGDEDDEKSIDNKDPGDCEAEEGVIYRGI